MQTTASSHSLLLPWLSPTLLLLILSLGLLSYETTSLRSLCEGIQAVDIVVDTTPSPSQQDTTTPPKHHPAKVTTRTETPTECSSGQQGGMACVSHTVKLLYEHRTGLTVLMALLAVVLLGLIIFFLVKLSSTYSRRRRTKNQRYKSISKYFPFSYKKQAASGIVIPAVGVPKAGATERQVLLNDSDEDEL